MARHLVLSVLLALVPLASATSEAADLEAAMVAEGAACDGTEDACQVHLLQLRAQGLAASEDEAVSEQAEESMHATDWSIFGTTEKCCQCKNGDAGWSASGKCSFCTGKAKKTKSVKANCTKASKTFAGNTACAKSCQKVLGLLEADGVELLLTDADEAALVAKDEAVDVDVQPADAAAADADAGADAAPAAADADADAESAAARGGKCSAADAAAMKKLGGGSKSGSFPEVVAKCARSAYSFWSGFNEHKLNDCVHEKTHVGSSCATCFGAAGQYGYKHCKLECLFSWCSSKCLSCAGDGGIHSCAGVVTPKAAAC